MESLLPWLGGSLGVFVAGAVAGATVALLAAAAGRARLAERLRRAELDAAVRADVERDAEELRTRLAVAEARRSADAERLAWIHTADEQLRASFDTLAARALEKNADGLLARSERQLGRLTDDVTARLKSLEGELRALESARTTAYAGLRQEIALLRDAHGELRASAAGLRTALASPNVRGRWGEAHLRRVVELAGMVANVDFVEQTTVGGQRPDMVIRLPDGGCLPVDAKTPLEAYLAACETSDATERSARLDEHARALSARIGELAGRAYWRQFEQSPDVVVLYVPNESALAAAFDRDPGLLDRAFARRVLPASPVTLLALLKTVAFGWQQQRIASSARAIADSGRVLHERLERFLSHLHRAGRGLDTAVEAFNTAVGSLERRVLPAARRLGEEAAIDREIPAPTPVSRQPRRPVRESDDEPTPAVRDEAQST